MVQQGSEISLTPPDFSRPCDAEYPNTHQYQMQLGKLWAVRPKFPKGEPPSRQQAGYRAIRNRKGGKSCRTYVQKPTDVLTTSGNTLAAFSPLSVPTLLAWVWPRTCCLRVLLGALGSKCNWDEKVERIWEGSGNAHAVQWFERVKKKQECNECLLPKGSALKDTSKPLAGVLVIKVVTWYSGLSHQNELTAISGHLARP
ncbi:hypothetical protein EV426DRAFT_577648 [Tirmania nivea]|nr:hypothetical protein EV426DRAFT_577648 [Tirmania nivea]